MSVYILRSILNATTTGESAVNSSSAVIWVPQLLETGARHYERLAWKDLAAVAIDSGTATLYTCDEDGNGVIWGKTRERRAIAALIAHCESAPKKWLPLAVLGMDGPESAGSARGFVDVTAVETFKDSTGMHGFNCFDVCLKGGLLVGIAVASQYDSVLKIIEASWESASG